MVKNVLFLMTHYGSGWQELVTALEKNARIHVFNSNRSYSHPDDVKFLTSESHRRHNSASIWADLIFENKDFSMKYLCEHYRFIFWFKPLDECNEEIDRFGSNAEQYWSYRRYGLLQYYRRCSKALWNPDLQCDTFLDAILR